MYMQPLVLLQCVWLHCSQYQWLYAQGGLSEASSGWASICSGKDIPTMESGLSHGHPEHGSTWDWEWIPKLCKFSENLCTTRDQLQVLLHVTLCIEISLIGNLFQHVSHSNPRRVVLFWESWSNCMMLHNLFPYCNTFSCVVKVLARWSPHHTSCLLVV